MNNDEAKFRLRAYRPGGADAGDPALREALEQAKHDPALAAWFEREQAHGRAVAQKLGEVQPPAGLREAILAGARASKPKERAVRPRWRSPWWMMAAAALVVLGTMVTWWRAPVAGATLDEFAVNFVARGFVLQKHSADVGELRAWLAERKGPLPEALPAKFAELRALGCRTLDFRGREVSLVCFERGGKEYHVFVGRRSDFGDEAGTGATAGPRAYPKSGLVAASWTDARHRYVLVSDADLAAVRGVL